MHADSDQDILTLIPQAATIQLSDLLKRDVPVLYDAVRQVQRKADSQVECITAFGNAPAFGEGELNFVATGAT